MSDARGPIQFMLGPSARLYFENLEKSSTSGKFSILLQKYWLCAQLGMVHGRKGNDDGNRKAIIANIAPPLAEHAQNIRAAAFYQHCADFALNPKDEEEMLSTMKSFFDQERPHKLGQMALRMLDDYAEGGFQILQEKIPRPTDLADFLVDYVELINVES